MHLIFDSSTQLRDQAFVEHGEYRGINLSSQVENLMERGRVMKRVWLLVLAVLAGLSVGLAAKAGSFLCWTRRAPAM